MSDLNLFCCSGRLTKDAELKQKIDLLEFTVAVNFGWGNNEKTLFIKCNIWGKRATDKLCQCLNKGTGVILAGELSLNKWTSKDGTEVQELVLNVNQLSFSSYKKAEPEPEPEEMTTF